MALPNAKPFSLQSPDALIELSGGNKQKLLQMVQAGSVDQTSALLAAMKIDKIRSAAQLEQAPQQTVMQKAFAPPAPPAPPAGLGSLPPGGPAPQGAPPMAPPQGAPPMQMASAPAPQGMPQMAGGGLTTLPIPDSMLDERTFADGGIVAFAKAGSVDAKAEQIKALMDIARKGGPEGRAAAVKLNSLYGQGSSDMKLPDLAPLAEATYDGPRGMALLDALDKYTGMPQPGDRAPQPVSSLKAGKPGIFGNPGAFTPPDLSSITDAAQRQNDADMATSYGLPFSAPDMSGFGRLAANIGNADAAGDVLHAAGAGMAAKGLYDKLPAFRPLVDPKKTNWDPMSNPGYGVKTEKQWYEHPTGFALPTSATPKERKLGDKHPEYGPKSLPMPEDDLYGTLPQFDVAGGSKPTPAARALAAIAAGRTPPTTSTGRTPIGASTATTTPRTSLADIARSAATAKNVPTPTTRPNLPTDAAAAPEMSDEELRAKRNKDFLEANKIPEYKGASAEEKAARKNEDLWTSLAQIGFGMAAGKSQNALSNIGEAAAAAMPGMQASLKERRADDKEELKQKYAYELAKAGVTGKAYEFSINQFDKLKDNRYRESTLAETIRHNEAQERLTKQQIAASGVTGTERLMRDWINADPKRRESMKNFFEAQSPYGGQKLNLAEQTAITNAEKNIDAKYKDQVALLSVSKKRAPELAALMQKINAEKYEAAQRITRSSLGSENTETPPPPSGYIEH